MRAYMYMLFPLLEGDAERMRGRGREQGVETPPVTCGDSPLKEGAQNEGIDVRVVPPLRGGCRANARQGEIILNKG